MRRYRRPYRLRKKKPIFKKKFFWLATIFFLIVGGFFYLFFFSSVFEVKEVNVFGNKKVLSEDLIRITEEQINKKILVFCSRSIFLVDLGKIDKTILARFPLISEAKTGRNLPNKLVIRVKERVPVAVFCQDKECFYIDKEGIIFEPVSKEKNLLKLRRENLKSKLNLGEKLIGSDFLSNLLNAYSQIEDRAGIDIIEAEIVSENKVEIKTSENWRIYLNPKGDIDWQLTKLIAVLNKEISSQKRKDLDWIELRFGNFAPYKYKNKEK